GLIDRHRDAMSAAAAPAARDYYAAAIICLEAVLAWNERHLDALRKLLTATTDPADRERLAASIAVMERVPARPARTFHEALQSFYFQWLAVMYEVPYGGNSPGRLDYFLWPWLEPELAAGTLDYQAATEQVAELFIKLDE